MSSTPIWIYDKDENIQTILKSDSNIPHFDSWFREVLNGAIELTFSVPASDPEVSVITNDGRAVIRDKDGEFVEFIIRSPEDTNGPDGPIKNVFAEGGDYELIDEWMTGYKADNVSLEVALNTILTNTRWTIGEIDDFQTESVNIEPTSVKNAIMQLLAIYGGEVKYRIEHNGNRITKRYINILKRRGNDNGKWFEYGKDIQSITYTPDSTGIKTRLYGYGASTENDGPRLNFADVEWRIENGDPADKPLGQIYISDPEALEKWGYESGTRHRSGKYSGQEEDPAELLLNTWKDLQTKTGRTDTYDMKVSLLEHIPGYEHEIVRLGDTAVGLDRVVQPNIQVKHNIIEYRQSLNDSSLDEVTIGQFRNTLDIAGRQRQMGNVLEDKQGNWNEKETPEGAQEKAENEAQKVLDEAQERIDEAQLRIDASEIELEEAKLRIEEAKLELEEAEGRIDQAVLDLTQLGVDLGIAEVEISNANDRIDTAFTDIQAAEGRIGTARGDISNLEGDLSNGRFSITNNTILTGTIGASSATFLNMTTRNMTAISATIENSTVTGTLTATNSTIVRGTFNDIIANRATIANATVTGTIGANNATFTFATMNDMTTLRATIRNSTITGTLTANNATIMKGTFDQATIVNADIEDATITGSLVGVGGTFTGTLTAVDGTFTGRLTAATGTFAGNLSAAGGTFSGTLQAVNGSFGTITSGTIRTLTIGGVGSPIIYFGSESSPSGWINYFDGSMRFQRDVATYYRVNSNSTDNRFQHQFYTGGAVAMNIGNSGSHKSLTAGNAMLKFSTASAQVQVRNVADNAFASIAASSFSEGSSRYLKKNIETYTGNALEKIKNTPVRFYHLLEDIDEVDPKRIGIIVEESPQEVVDILGGRTLNVGAKSSLLWKAVQELLVRVEQLEG